MTESPGMLSCRMSPRSHGPAAGTDAPICQDTRSGGLDDLLASEETFQAPDDLSLGSAVRRAACDVINGRLMVPHADDDGSIEGGVGVSVAASIEAVPAGGYPGRCRDRTRAAELRGVVARIVTGPHDANRQDPHLPMRYDSGRPRAIIRLRISQPRTASLPCPAGLRARRPSPMMDLERKNAFSSRP